MERVHRIGQTKPVRVFRLVCRGSVEERMISRAEKKLFLNAMVAEIDPDEQLNEHAKKHGDEAMEALGIGGSAMSKAELASLIRFGANAVFESEESSQSRQISEEELNRLLERDGRDETIEPPLLSSKDNNTTSANANATDEESAFAKAQANLKDRMENLKELDLRQLGNVVYTKKKSDKRRKSDDISTLDPESNPLILTEKRQRKERIVMIDMGGLGAGFLGDLRRPVLALPVDQVIGQLAGVFFHAFPPDVAVIGQGHVGEDHVLVQAQHAVRVGLHVGAGGHAKVTGFGVDGVHLAVSVGLDPGDVVTNRGDLPAFKGFGGHQHREVGLAAGAGESGRDVVLLAFGRGHAQDQHVLGQPACVARCRCAAHVGSNAQRKAFFAEQGVAAIA